MTGGAPIRVLIADDNADVRDALTELIRSVPEFELAAATATASEAVELAARERPHVALVDVRMPAGGGVAAARGIVAGSPGTRIVAFSASGVLPETLDSIVVDSLVKGTPIDDIIDSVKRAADA